MTTEELFTDWLVRQRGKRGWTQEQFAEKIGFSQAAVSRVEGGLIPPTAKFISAVADAFDLPPDEVYRAAGLLPPVGVKDEWAAKMYRRMEKLPPELRDIAESFIDVLYQKEQEKKKKRV